MPPSERYLNRHTSPDGSDIAEKLDVLSSTWIRNPSRSAGPPPVITVGGFAYVNGGIFANPVSIPASVGKFSRRSLGSLGDDWSKFLPISRFDVPIGT